MSFSHLQRAPRSKKEFKSMDDEWGRKVTSSSEAKRRANVNGTGDEVQPYIDRMNAVSSAHQEWLRQYDHTYQSLPER